MDSNNGVLLVHAETRRRGENSPSPPCRRVNPPKTALSSHQLPHVGQVAGYRRRRRHRGADEVGPRARPLAADEVAVAGRCAAFARGHLVGVHRETRRTARLAPLESRVDEDAVESLGLGLALDRPRPGAEDGPFTARALFAALDVTACGAPVLPAASR